MSKFWTLAGTRKGLVLGLLGLTAAALTGIVAWCAGRESTRDDYRRSRGFVANALSTFYLPDGSAWTLTYETLVADGGIASPENQCNRGAEVLFRIWTLGGPQADTDGDGHPELVDLLGDPYVFLTREITTDRVIDHRGFVHNVSIPPYARMAPVYLSTLSCHPWLCGDQEFLEKWPAEKAFWESATSRERKR